MINLLPITLNATSILGTTKPFLHLKYLKTEVDSMGRDNPIFDIPKKITGSIQSVLNKMYEQFGLDLNKNYKVIFSLELIKSLANGIQPDRVIYNNQTFEVVENKDWYETQGYTKILVVELKELRNDSATNEIQN